MTTHGELKPGDKFKLKGERHTMLITCPGWEELAKKNHFTVKDIVEDVGYAGGFGVIPVEYPNRQFGIAWVEKVVP